jgi:hypothetical protein
LDKSDFTYIKNHYCPRYSEIWLVAGETLRKEGMMLDFRSKITGNLDETKVEAEVSVIDFEK